MNVQVDPEAAKIVFESGLDIIMVPLEVTHTALVTNEVMAGERRLYIVLSWVTETQATEEI